MTDTTDIAGRLRAHATLPADEPDHVVHCEERVDYWRGAFFNGQALAGEAAAEIDALRTRAETAESSLASTLASVDGMREALGKQPEWLDQDEGLVDAFHTELKRQGAFSVERYGTVALAMAPFMQLVWDAVRARALSAGPNGGNP